MKNETSNGMTRRSFMKRSTVAAIAATNLMMFTGLVNADELSPSPQEDATKCIPKKTDAIEILRINNVNVRANVFICEATGCDQVVPCGSYVKFDNNNNIILDENGKPLLFDVNVQCVKNGNAIPVICFKENILT